MAVIRRYYNNYGPPYLGFNAEGEARSSFAAFQASGELPAGLFSPTSLRSLNSSPIPSSQSPLPLTPYPRGTTPTSPPLRFTPHTPIRAAAQVQSAFTPRTPVRPALQMRGNLGSTSNSSHRDLLSPIPAPLSPMRRNNAPTTVVTPMFYLVIEGDAPGVYGSQ